VNGAKRKKKAVILWGGAVSHRTALSGFPSGEEGETNSYMGRRGACGGGSEVLGPAPTALGLSPSQPLSLSGWDWGAHGFAGVGPSPWLCDPYPHSLVLASLLSSPSSPPLDCSFGEGGRVLGKVPQVTEQTAPTAPQPPGWRKTRFWFSGSMNTQRYTSYHRRKQ